MNRIRKLARRREGLSEVITAILVILLGVVLYLAVNKAVGPAVEAGAKKAGDKIVEATDAIK